MKTFSSSSYKAGDLLELRIERIVPNGFGIGFAEGLTVFTPLTAPGDLARIQIKEIKKKIAFAEIVEIITPSAERIAPPCKYFGTCGGCDFQQMNYQAQLEAKVGIIRDCLKRIGKIDWPGEISIIGSPREFEYRSRAQWHIDTRSRKFGYFKRNSHEIIDIEKCPILVPELEAMLEKLRTSSEYDEFWTETARIDAASGDDGTVSIFSPDTGVTADEISSSFAGETYFYSAQGFFQGNRSMVEQLVDVALKDASGESAIDFYCGVGLFSLPLARKFGNVTAVEENENAVEFAEKNSLNAELANIRFICNKVDRFLRQPNLPAPDFLLLDPPRSGADPETIRRITELRPKRISYVSCEPSILARDLRTFLDGGYIIESITALDLFPQTHHVETVARLGLA